MRLMWRCRGAEPGSRGETAQPFGIELRGLAGAEEGDPAGPPALQDGRQEKLECLALQFAAGDGAPDGTAGRVVEAGHLGEHVLTVEHGQHEQVGVDIGRASRRRGHCKARHSSSHTVIIRWFRIIGVP